MIKFFKLIKPLSGKLIRDEHNSVIFESTWEETDFMFGVEIVTKKREEHIRNIVPTGNSVKVEFETFEVISHEEFWGPGGKVAFLERLIAERPRNIASLEFDENGEAICPIKIFSMSKLQSENKNTMAHIMFELGIFKSVGEARKNGWNKPIELGEFCVTKKKIKFEVVE